MWCVFLSLFLSTICRTPYNFTLIEFHSVNKIKQKEKIKNVHDEQVLEYKKEGKRALIDYSRKCSLPVGDSSDPNHTLKCIRHALNGAPNWNLPRSTVLAILQKVIQVRLNSKVPSTSSSPSSKALASQTPAATSQKPAPVPPKVMPKQQNEPVPASTLEEGEEEEEKTPVVEGGETVPASGDEGEIEEGEEGEEDEEEEDEETEDDAADGDATEKSEKKSTATSHRMKGLLAKKRALGKTAGPKKKGTAVKGGRTGTRGGRMPRRGGRGGGKA